MNLRKDHYRMLSRARDARHLTTRQLGVGLGPTCLDVQTMSPPPPGERGRPPRSRKYHDGVPTVRLSPGRPARHTFEDAVRLPDRAPDDWETTGSRGSVVGTSREVLSAGSASALPASLAGADRVRPWPPLPRCGTRGRLRSSRLGTPRGKTAGDSRRLGARGRDGWFPAKLSYTV